MSSLHNFNAGRKSWKMYAKQLTSKDGDDLTITPYEGEDLILEVSGNGNISFKEDGITYNLADLSNAASSNVNLTNYDDASLNNLDISGNLTFKGGDFNFNYVAGATPNYINSFNYLANTTLIDANSDSIFTNNNTNLDITYSPTLNIFVNLRRDSLLYSYDGISWYFCKKSDNSNFSFNGKYGGTIEWFSGNVNKFYVSLTHAGFTSTDSIYYSSNGINWTNITVNGGAYQFMPHKLAYSPTLNKIVATGSGNNKEGLWVGDATGSSLDFANITTNNEFISPWESNEGTFPIIWDTNLEKFILTTEQTGGGKQIYYNADNNLTSWTLLTNIYDFNNNLTTDGTLNKTCHSIAFSSTLNRSVFVGGDAIYYSDFVGGTAISNLVFKQTKDINGSNYSGSPTYRKIIWDSVSEYFIIAANAGSHDVIYSTNGINWFSNNQETSTPSGYLARGHGALAYGNGKLILIGYHNNNVYQTDSNYIAPPYIQSSYNFGHNNLDASLNKLDINGVINFFATDEQLLGPDTGIAQKVQDLSNNLLISNNDASFNNLEISGKIKLPDSSNNGYGVSGELLISRGATNAPIWGSVSSGVSNVKVYGGIWCDGDYIISIYTLWGGESANPISTNLHQRTAEYDFVNSHPNMWISPPTQYNSYWHGKTGNGNVLQIPRDGYYYIEMKQIIHNSVYQSNTITVIEMWVNRLPAPADATVAADIIASWRWTGQGSNLHTAIATYTGFCKAGDLIFGQFYVVSSGGIILGDGNGHPAGAVAADGQSGARSSGFSVFSID